MSNLTAQDDLPMSAKEIRIGSFRGLKDVVLEELGQVNLLVGGNNSGKTSVLEAIAILHAGNDLRSWLNVAYAREVRSFMPSPGGVPVVDTLSWMFPSNDSDIWDHTNAGPIEISAELNIGKVDLYATLEQISGYYSDDDMRATGRMFVDDNGGSDGDPILDMDLHRFRSGRVLMLGGLLFESHG